MQRVSPLFLALLGGFLVSGFVLSQQLFVPDLGVDQIGLVGRISILAFIVFGWIVSVCLHEFAHAFVAYRLGDAKIAEKGYLNLDPRKYVDPLNSLILPLIVILLGGFALPGAAVYVRSSAFAFRWQRSLVSLAGPATNLTLFIVCCLPFLWGAPSQSLIWPALAALAFLQLTACLFNLLPIPGFDGYGVLSPFLSGKLVAAISKHQSRIMLGALCLFIFFPSSIRSLIAFATFVTTQLGVPADGIQTGMSALHP